MQNLKIIRMLYIALAAEVALALFCLLVSGNWITMLVFIMIYGLLAGGVYLLQQLGLWQNNWWEAHRVPGVNPTPNNWSPPMGINLGTGPERTEVVNLNVPVEADISALQVDVNHGSLRVIGEEGVTAIKIVATKKVYTRDEYTARNELDRLQVRHRREGSILKIDAGAADAPGSLSNFTIGRSARIDLDITVPLAMAASFSNSMGDLVVRNFQGELNARTGAGSLIVENYNSGRNLNLSSNAGRIALQQIAAGTVRARTGAGTIELTGVGAESFELESAAGMIRARGVNCARYVARAQLGSADLYDARIERELELSATAGRVQAENITTNSFRIETTTGMVFYRGTPPLYNSSAKSALGAVELLLVAGGAFNLDARSNVGNVTVGLPISTTYTSTRNAFSGVVGAGGPQLQVQTQVGSIRVAQV